MTSAQAMLLSRLRTAVLAAALAGILPSLPACARERPIVRPAAIVSPYHARRQVVFAVAPMRNESGVSVIDELAVSDALVNEAQQVEGLSVLPVNRTLAAMRALGMGRIANEAEAMALCRALGADAVVVGTITAWHPYDPPMIGMSLALLGWAPEVQPPPATPIDSVGLRSSPTDAAAHDSAGRAQPLSAVSEVLDASHGGTLLRVREYAEGRHDPRSALGWRRYTASMSLYAKFACHEMTRRLLDAERQRLGLEGARVVKSHDR